MNTRNYRLSLYRALWVAILSYLYGEPLLNAFKVAFSFRKLFNEAFEAGVSPEQISEMFSARFPDDDKDYLT